MADIMTVSVGVDASLVCHVVDVLECAGDEHDGIKDQHKDQE